MRACVHVAKLRPAANCTSRHRDMCLYTARRAHALLYGHALMDLASLLTAAANGAGEHILSMRCVHSRHWHAEDY